MLCPVEFAGEMSALQAVRVRDHAKHGKLLECRDGPAMKVQEVILQAMARKITWYQAAEILANLSKQRGGTGR